MGHLEFQITGLQSSPQSKRRGSQRQTSLIVGALLATAIFARTHSASAPSLAISISNMPEFGNQLVGAPASVQPLVIQNSGTDTLHILRISALTSEGNDSSDFIVSQDRCAPSPIEQGASCQIGIEFIPKGIGLRKANLVITDNAPGSPQTFSMVGAGILPPHADARADPPIVDFGTVALEDSKDSPVSVLNIGDSPLNIEKIQFDGDPGPFLIASQPCDNATIQARGSCQITVTFSPHQPGSFAASISIPHGDTYPLTVPIRGAASGPRLGYCCMGGRLDEIATDEATCVAHSGNFSENLEELKRLCQRPKRQLALPVPIKPGSASMEQSENLYPCNSIPLMWKPVEDPGEAVSYNVSLYSYSEMLARLGQNPWQPFLGLPPTTSTQLDLTSLPPFSYPKTAMVVNPKTAMMTTSQPPPSQFYWQVVASDSSGNVSPPSDPRYFQCKVVFQ